MTQDEIIRMAREAGFAIDSSMEESIILIPQGWTFFSLNAAMQKFAALVAEATKAQPQGEPVACWCRTCRPITLDDMRFVVCPDCGNKRCPKANDHRHDCTNSNEPGQKGSAYEYTTPPVVPQEPVAWLIPGSVTTWPELAISNGKNAIPLYPPEAVEAMRIETLEKAAKEGWMAASSDCEDRVAAAIRSMK